jgi:hypothetical protein
MAPRRYLVIANQTLAEAELTEAIRQRQQSGPSSFYLLVPDTDHGDLAARLARAAPLTAVDQLLERQQFDEILLSTLPQPISKWLGKDLPHRLHRHTGLPVTTITAKRVI